MKTIKHKKHYGKMIPEDVLIMDIEAECVGSKPDGTKDIHRITGAYSYKDKKIHYAFSTMQIQNLIDSHKVIVGHNFEKYDRPALENIGVNFYGKIIVDTMEIAKKRLEPLMNIKPLNFSLANLMVELDLETFKGDIDYNVFKKTPQFWTPQEKADIAKYLKQDIICTKNLFEKFYNQFIVFHQFVDERNKRNWSWLKCSSGSLSYKILCNLGGLEEEYSNEKTKREKVGGIVLTPTGEEFEEIWYVDFSSLYPNIFAMFNLFGNPTLRPDCIKWFTGNDMFQIEGKYAVDEQHPLSKKTVFMFNERMKIKFSNPPLAYGYKIILNGEYGVCRSKKFKSTYYEHTGGDCCRIGQRMNKLIGEVFDKYSFFSKAGDTDSRFVKYEGEEPKTIEEQYELLMKACDEIVKIISQNVPFPNPTFKLESETGNKPIKYIKFVKDGDKFLKKNYMYIYERNGEDKVEIKGLPIIKSPATKVGKLILKKYLKPEIIKRGHARFTREEIMNWVDAELANDISLAATNYKVKPYNSYSSKGCIQAKISKAFFGGEGGRIDLVKNNRMGDVKTGCHFLCTVDKAEKMLKPYNLVLETLDTEIKPFVKQKEKKNVMKLGEWM